MGGVPAWEYASNPKGAQVQGIGMNLTPQASKMWGQGKAIIPSILGLSKQTCLLQFLATVCHVEI